MQRQATRGWPFLKGILYVNTEWLFFYLSYIGFSFLLSTGITPMLGVGLGLGVGVWVGDGVGVGVVVGCTPALDTPLDT